MPAATTRKASTKPAAIGENVGDVALKAKTGKTWKQWIAVLDKAKAYDMPHKQIAEYLHDKLGVPGWWCQMIAVGYEQAKGIRVKHQRPDGFEISVSKTIAIPASKAFDVWLSTTNRKKFLKEKIVLRTATPPKSARFDWPDGNIFELRVYPRTPDKCQVVVQHFKLSSAKAAEAQKKFWSERLAILKSVAEA
ncbi:MAG: hypothetical protein NDJ18_07295 [candidate division Zixibacteria bacterium]|nr:hypothetical protein [candidate division Zixibacteria bacterium]